MPRAVLASSAYAQQSLSAARPASAPSLVRPASAAAHGSAASAVAVASPASHASVRTLSAALAFEAAEVLGALGEQGTAREILGMKHKINNNRYIDQ